MSVIIDSHSASRLIAEGAICFDTDTDVARCDGLPVRLPSGRQDCTRPILVCGSSAAANEALVDYLQSQGLPAWRVRKIGPDGVESAEGVGCAPMRAE